MYAKGSSYQDIIDFYEEKYGVEISKNTIHNITEKVLPLITEWQSRELETVYPIVWLDAMFIKIRGNGIVKTKRVYCVLGMNCEGKKDVLSIHISEAEGAKFWLQVLTDLSERGVKDILIACVDGLKGFPEAINTIFPETEVQLCIVHQIRNSLKYISRKDYKEFIADLKKVYQAPTKEVAEENLKGLEEQWTGKYAIAVKSWTTNWDNLSNYFQYPSEIRKLIYTTNAIEGFNRQVRKVIKTKGALPSENAIKKLIFLAVEDITKKWRKTTNNWQATRSQIALIFEERLRKYGKL